MPNPGQSQDQTGATVVSQQAVQAGAENQADNNTSANNGQNSNTRKNTPNNSTANSTPGAATDATGQELTQSEEAEVRELKQRDQEVRQHEQAHSTVGGPYAGSPQYSYTTGPDGKRYAVSGEVPIDASPVRDNPEATIRKMDVVIRAALAPADPSPQDQQVAAEARQNRLQAQNDLNNQHTEDLNGDAQSASPASVANAVQAYQQNSIDPGTGSGKSVPAESLTITV